MDYVSGDEFLSDSFPHEITMNDACIEAKAKYMTRARGYLAKVTAKLTELGKADRVPGFKKGAVQLVKLIAANFAEMQLFVGTHEDYEGAMCFAYQKEQDDEGPTFLFFKDGLKEQKF